MAVEDAVRCRTAGGGRRTSERRRALRRAARVHGRSWRPCALATVPPWTVSRGSFRGVGAHRFAPGEARAVGTPPAGVDERFPGGPARGCRAGLCLAAGRRKKAKEGHARLRARFPASVFLSATGRHACGLQCAGRVSGRLGSLDVDADQAKQCVLRIVAAQHGGASCTTP